MFHIHGFGGSTVAAGATVAADSAVAARSAVAADSAVAACFGGSLKNDTPDTRKVRAASVGGGGGGGVAAAAETADTFQPLREKIASTNSAVSLL